LLQYRLNIFITFLVLRALSSSFGQSCEVLNQPHYVYEDIKAILDKNKCNSCHYNGASQSKWSYDSYKTMFVRDACGAEIIKRGIIQESSLIDKINGGSTSCGHSMPYTSEVVSSNDLFAIEAWIEFGAPETCIPIYEDIKLIFDNNKCGNCHFPLSATPWTYDTYYHTIENSTNAACSSHDMVVKHDAEASLLFRKLLPLSGNICGEVMRNEGAYVSDSDVGKIRDWINAGALSNGFILPVTLSSFDVVINKDDEAVLSWGTLSEYSTRSFEIQYCQDGKNFVSIGSSEAKFPSGGTYNEVHQDTKVGFNYYRLKMVDDDNSFRYSQSRVVRSLNSDELLTVFPTITSAGKYSPLQVTWYPTVSREATYMNIMDISGRQMHKELILIGHNFVDISSLNPGLYYLTVTDFNGVTIARRIVITG
jgi:hypothetical protein